MNVLWNYSKDKAS